MAYIYCRISTGKGCSLDYQEAEIRKVTDRLKWNIKETIKYSGSAYNVVPARLAELSKKKNKKILFYTVDRFSRNFLKGKELAIKFITNKNTLYFVRERLCLDGLDGVKWDVFEKYLTQAEKESDNISRRVVDAKRHLEAQGYFTGAVAPFGFKKHKLENGRTKLVKLNETDDVIRFIRACKTVGTDVSEINRLLKVCGGDTDKDPIELDGGEKSKSMETDTDEEDYLEDKTYSKKKKAKLSSLEDVSDSVTEPLTNGNIAHILDSYGIETFDGKKWTSSKIKRIFANMLGEGIAETFETMNMSYFE